MPRGSYAARQPRDEVRHALSTSIRRWRWRMDVRIRLRRALVAWADVPRGVGISTTSWKRPLPRTPELSTPCASWDPSGQSWTSSRWPVPRSAPIRRGGTRGRLSATGEATGRQCLCLRRQPAAQVSTAFGPKATMGRKSTSGSIMPTLQQVASQRFPYWSGPRPTVAHPVRRTGRCDWHECLSRPARALGHIWSWCDDYGTLTLTR